MNKDNIDYTVYLVTDSGLVPEGLTLEHQVEQAIAGGATVIQLREKTAETRDFVKKAQKIHQLTKSRGIPLIINDRLDVVLATGAEGIHVGQDDMDIATIRQYLGPEKIIGVSVNDISEAEQAVKDKVDYVGIGAVYGTMTKELKKQPIGVSGVRKILEFLEGTAVKSVAIGGINSLNAGKVMCLSSSPQNQLDGVAVVSCVMAAKDAASATRSLVKVITNQPAWLRPQSTSLTAVDEILMQVPMVIAKVAEKSPLVHHITNNVVKNISANISIAVGASPAMSECPQEFEDFSNIPNAGLLINMGSTTVDGISMFEQAIKWYNRAGRPIVFDPVGAGASRYRKQLVADILNSGSIDVVKGNEGEITAAAGVAGVEMRGVDSVGSSSVQVKLDFAKKLATEAHTTVLMTGEKDVLVEGTGKQRAYLFENGHDYLSKITGSGCILGSLITACTAVAPEDRILSTSAALLIYTLAAERAVDRGTVQGPGTFVPALLDEVYAIALQCQNGSSSWLKNAKITPLH